MSAPTESNRSPSHVIYGVTEREGQEKKAFWNRIGVMFPCKGGFQLLLDYIPRDGSTRLVAQEPREDDDAPRRD